MKLIKLLMIGLLTSTEIFGVTFDPRPTRDIIIDIDTTVTTCVCPLEVDFQGTFSTLENMTDLLEGLICNATLITQAQVGTTGLIITNSGAYKLKENITFNPVGSTAAITINADNVLLDLQCFSIIQGNATANVDGISVTANHKNIIITNGRISNFSRNGISIASGCNNLATLDITITNCLKGISCVGTVGSPIQIMQLVDLDLLANHTGASFTSVGQASMSDCSFIGNTQAGIELITSFSNSIVGCLINNTNATTGSAFGITLTGGADNRIESCMIDGVSTNDTSVSNVAAGIFIGNTENSDIISNNQISNVTTTSNAVPFGIDMAYSFSGSFVVASKTEAVPANSHGATWSPNNRFYVVLLPQATSIPGFQIYEQKVPTQFNIAVASPNSNETSNSYSWSPDGKYLVQMGFDASDNYTLIVFLFNGSSLTQIATAGLTNNGLGGGATTVVQWSSNGRYIVAGFDEQNTAPNLQVFEFTGTTLNLVASTNDFGVGSGPHGVTGVSFSPDGNFVAACGENGQTSAISLRIYRFTGNNLIFITSLATNNPNFKLAWSPNGQFIFGPATGATTNYGTIYRFNGTTLTPISTIVIASTSAGDRTSSWSPDGNFIAFSFVSSGNFLQIYSFNGQTTQLVSSITLANIVENVSWSPGGNLIVANTLGANPQLLLLNGLQFPKNHTIMQNEISFVKGPALAQGQPGSSSGRGLSASSSSNLILQNTAFNNDINYVFVNNVFQQYVTNTVSVEPSILSNLSFPPL